MTAEEILQRLDGVKRAGNGWSARCKAHEDSRASLSVTPGKDGRTLLHCHAGCAPEAICAAIGIKLADLMPPQTSRNGHATKPRIVASYDYTDEAGALLFQVCRLDPKDFRQRRPDPDKPGSWLWKMGGVRRVPYRLPELITAVAAGRMVFIVEGEKDCDALVKAGFVATCNPGGAGKWLNSFTPYFKGADVVVIPDRDKPGREHGRGVARKLHGTASSVRVLELPDGKDASDWLSAGGEASELDELVQAAPLWSPESEEERSSAPVEGSNDLRGRIIAILCDGNIPARDRKPAIARVVVEWLESAGQFYFHEERRDFASAMFFDATRKILLRVQGDEFISWLSTITAINRADSGFAFVLRAVEDAALSGKQTRGILPESFWSRRKDSIYISNGDARLVRIRPGTIELLDNGSDGVLFPREGTLAPWKLIEPADPLEACSVFRDANFAAGHGKDLLRSWCYSIPTNPRCKPPLALTGPVGSGKTRVARALSELFGLQYAEAKCDESREGDFWPGVDRGGIYTLDNADSKIDWLPDALASAATDGCSLRRRLYTDAATVTLRARAWLIITSANPVFGSDAGLADRLLVVRMGRRQGDTADSALTDEVVAHRDAGLSYIAETLQRALADTAPTPPNLNVRHPDFGAFAVRIGRAIGREAEAVASLSAAETDKSLFCLENDWIGAALLACVSAAGSFSGTADELRVKLVESDRELEGKLSAKRLGKKLSALWPHIQGAFGTAAKGPDRTGIMRYTFAIPDPEPAGFAGFQSTFSSKPLTREFI